MLASLESKEERKYIPPHHSYSALALHSLLLLPLTHSLPFPPPSPSPLLSSSHTCIIFSNLTYPSLSLSLPLSPHPPSHTLTHSSHKLPHTTTFTPHTFNHHTHPFTYTTIIVLTAINAFRRRFSSHHSRGGIGKRIHRATKCWDTVF